MHGSLKNLEECFLLDGFAIYYTCAATSLHIPWKGRPSPFESPARNMHKQIRVSLPRLGRIKNMLNLVAAGSTENIRKLPWFHGVHFQRYATKCHKEMEFIVIYSNGLLCCVADFLAIVCFLCLRFCCCCCNLLGSSRMVHVSALAGQYVFLVNFLQQSHRDAIVTSSLFFRTFSLSWIVLFWSLMIVLQDCGLVSAPPATVTSFSRSRWLWGDSRPDNSWLSTRRYWKSLTRVLLTIGFIFQKSMQATARLSAGNVSGLSARTVFRLP